MLKDLTRLALAVAAGALIVLAYTTWRIWDQGNQDEQRPADAIVVLGAAQYDGRPSPIFQARLDHAVELYRGGPRPGARRDRRQAARRPDDRGRRRPRGYAIAQGVPADAILVEDRGRTTLESLRAVADDAPRPRSRTARSSCRTGPTCCASCGSPATGIEAYGSPTRTSPIDASAGERLRATVHEVGALALYFLAGNEP